jgi:hypothetical protein
LFQDIVKTSHEVHDKYLDGLQQDTGDQPQLSIVEVSESSSAKNLTAEIRATSSTIEVNLLVSLNSFFSSFFLIYTSSVGPTNIIFNRSEWINSGSS